MLGLSVLAAQQCAEAEAEAAEPPENMLSYGLTHLWTSPILRYQLMKQGHASLQVHATCLWNCACICTARHVHGTACTPHVMCTPLHVHCMRNSHPRALSCVCALQLLEAAVLERYAAFRDNCTLKQQLRPGETANDAWFAEQRDAFQRGEDSWLEEEASGTAVAAAMVTDRHSNLWEPP
tara:strand:- start:281 stop:820 length:540 start_codon:yes stop_codon:yes gene_type:complete